METSPVRHLTENPTKSLAGLRWREFHFLEFDDFATIVTLWLFYFDENYLWCCAIVPFCLRNVRYGPTAYTGPVPDRQEL